MRILLPLGALSLVVGLAGCRSTKDVLNDYEKDLSYGQYDHASVEVAEKADAGGVDALCWQLHAAGAKSLAADAPEAVRRFDLAEDVFVKNDGQSVFSQGADGAYAMLTNDKVFPYAGGGQDRIFTCLYKAIDYGVMGKKDAMRTELNRAAQHQENWIDERRKDIEAAGERLRKDAIAYNKDKAGSGQTASEAQTRSAVDKAMASPSLSSQIQQKTGFDPACDGRLESLKVTKDYMDAYAQSVCGIFRWLSGDGDGKYYLRDAAGLKPANAMLRDDAAASASGTRPKNMVWVFVEDGLCPVREEWRIDLPLILIPGLNRYVLYAGMALPTLKYRNAAVTAYSAMTKDGTVQMAELENIDRLMKVEYDVYMRGALAREITRAIVKAGVQIALGVTAENMTDNYTQLALQMSQYAAAAWAASVTGADVRSWTGLPKSVSACRIMRPSDGVVTVNCGVEQIPITLPEGNSLVFVRKTSSAAQSVAKVVTFPN